MKLYPLRLGSVNKDIIWGGYRLGKEYGKPDQKIAEAWELTVYPEGINVIENGEYAGMPLSEYIGSAEGFPIMFKLIDACDRLSVQVHPVKTEMWYIVDCDEGATLVYGLKDKFSDAEFREAIEKGKVEELLQTVEVHKGDVFFIPQGLVHAIGKGILIAEIQENSNVTYRVYDYGRLQNGVPRELHVEKALETIRDFTHDDIEKLRFECGRERDTTIANCPLFCVDKIDVNGKYTVDADNGFVSVVCLEGSATIGGEDMKKGDSYYLPEGLLGTVIEGDCEIIVTRLP